jgi:polyhydroxyalkanoate synthesis regulator phasin
VTERTVLVRLRADPSAFNRGMMEAAAGVNALRKEINTTNERTAWLTQGILAIAPAVVPLGAAAIPVFTGLATEMTVGAAAAGVLALGMAGIGDSLKALNTYQLDPTEAHLKALNVSMSKLSSEGQDFVRFLDSLGGIGSSLQNTAQAGMFPGITSGLQDIITLAPQVRRIVREIAEGIGQLADEAGGELAGPKFREFFDWLEADAKPILIEMGHTIGHFAAGLTNLFVAFLPESESFIHGFERMSESFEKWTAGLEGSKGFENFLAYLDESGPQALDFIGALANALIAVIRAAAPVGSLLLPAFTQLLNIFAELVDTPIGSTFIAIAAAMSIYGRSAAIASNLTTGGMVKGFGMANTEALKTTASVRSLAANVSVLGRNMLTAGAATERMAAENRVAAAGLRTWAGGAARVGGQAALMGVVMSGVADKVHLGNTAMLAMAGSMAGPWGAAIGAGAGLLLDFASASGETVVAADDLRATLDEQTGAITKNTAAYVGNQFQQNGVYEAAKALGLNLNLVTQAALGNHAAITQLTPALAELASQQQTVSGGPHGGSGQVATETANQAQKVIDAISETGKVTKEQAAQIRELMGATKGAASATDTFADRQRKLRAALRDARNAARGSVDMWDALGESVDDSEVSLKQWITQMQRTADALVNFGRNAERAANRGLDQGLIKSLEALGPLGRCV